VAGVVTAELIKNSAVIGKLRLRFISRVGCIGGASRILRYFTSIIEVLNIACFKNFVVIGTLLLIY
jgi:hypothetical protein